MFKNSTREKYHFYNSLSILLRAIENERTTIDLRNEASILGIVEHVDAYMNVVMKDCTFTDPRGVKFNFDVFFVQARNIRFVQIPPKVRIIPAIKDQLQQLYDCRSIKPDINKHTFRVRRAQLKQQDEMLTVQKMLQNKKSIESNDTKDEQDIL